MPDDMLEDAINVSKTALDENEFESNGVEVSFNYSIIVRSIQKSIKIYILTANYIQTNIDSKNSQNTHGLKMGTIVACILGQIIRLPRCP